MYQQHLRWYQNCLIWATLLWSPSWYHSKLVVVLVRAVRDSNKHKFQFYFASTHHRIQLILVLLSSQPSKKINVLVFDKCYWFPSFLLRLKSEFLPPIFALTFFDFQCKFDSYISINHSIRNVKDKHWNGCSRLPKRPKSIYSLYK